MKGTTKHRIFLSFMLIISIIIVLLSRCNRDTTKSEPTQMVSITAEKLNQLIKQASTVKVERHDTIIYRDKIVVASHPIPISVIAPDSVRYYTDHILNSDINITIQDSVRGILLNRSYTYVPIIRQERVEITKTIPELVTVDAPKPVPKYKLQLALIGTYQNRQTALMGAEIGVVNKQNIGLHYQIQATTNQQWHSLKISKTFNF